MYRRLDELYNRVRFRKFNSFVVIECNRVWGV
jgi:hypothetical protein